MLINTSTKDYVIDNWTKMAIQLAECLSNNEPNSATFLLWPNFVAPISDIKMVDRIYTELNVLFLLLIIIRSK